MSNEAISETVPLVQAQNVGKSYHDFFAVKDLSFNILPGECFGLLGPNGAGKSTMMKLIYGAVSRTHGTLRVMGYDPNRQGKAIRQSLGVVMQEDALDEVMTVRDSMILFSHFHGLYGKQAAQSVDALLEFMGLGMKAREKIAFLSGGMKRRLAFVRALIPNPRLLILDEPTTGLDPAVRQALWDKIRELKRNGTTIILTTHYMDEAELLCDHLVLINRGVIQAEGRPQSLIKAYCQGYVGVYYDPQSGKHETIESTEPQSLMAQAQLEGKSAGIIRPANLEDVFIKITGRDLNV